MSWLPSVFNQLKLHIPDFRASSGVAIQQPLLSRDEIIALRLEAERISQHPKYLYEVSHRMSGEQRAKIRGSGMDYDDSRPYQPGDDPRYMNWRLTAKYGELFMKVFREERQPGICIVMDRRNSMRFGTRKRLKVTQAARVATLTAFLAQSRHTSISTLTIEDKLHWHNEVHTEQDVFNLVQMFVHACPPTQSVKTKDTFAKLLNTLDATLPQGTQIILISDFHDVSTEQRGLLFQLATSHQLRVIQVYDPAELNLPAAGMLNFYNLSDSATTTLNTDSTMVSNEYHRLASSRFDELETLFSGVGADYLQLATTDDKIAEVLTDT